MEAGPSGPAYSVSSLSSRPAPNQGHRDLGPQRVVRARVWLHLYKPAVHANLPAVGAARRSNREDRCVSVARPVFQSEDHLALVPVERDRLLGGEPIAVAFEPEDSDRGLGRSAHESRRSSGGPTLSSYRKPLPQSVPRHDRDLRAFVVMAPLYAINPNNESSATTVAAMLRPAP